MDVQDSLGLAPCLDERKFFLIPYNSSIEPAASLDGADVKALQNLSSAAVTISELILATDQFHQFESASHQLDDPESLENLATILESIAEGADKIRLLLNAVAGCAFSVGMGGGGGVLNAFR